MTTTVDLKFDPQHINLSYILQVRKYLVLTIALGLIAAGILSYLFFVQVTRVFELANHLQTEKQNLATLQDKVRTLQGTAFLEQADTRQKIDILLPSKKPLLQLLNNMGRAALDSQVTVAAIETAPGRIASGSAQLQTNIAQFGAEAETKKLNGLDVLTIGVTVNGTLAQINAFVKSIEQITPISDITHLELNRLSVTGNQSASEPTYQAELAIASYFFTQPVISEAEAPLPQVQVSEQAFLGNLNNFQFTAEVTQQVVEGGGLNDLFKSPEGQVVTP